MKENGTMSKNESSSCSSTTTLTSTSSSSSNGSSHNRSMLHQQKGLTFRDQMSLVCKSFDAMNECEQTVALCSLLKRVNSVQSKFICNYIDAQNQDESKVDFKRIEKDANHLATAKELESTSNENIIKHLLLYLPLMKPGNEQLKQQYLQLINRVASFSLTTSSHTDETRQILCYSLIHPAILQDEKRSLTYWCQQFETSIGHHPTTTMTSGAVTNSGEHLVSAANHLLTSWRNTQQQQFSSSYAGHQRFDGHQRSLTQLSSNDNNSAASKVRRSNSLTPICSSSTTTTTAGGPLWIDTSFRPSAGHHHQSSFLSSASGTSMDSVNNVMTTVASCQQDWDQQLLQQPDDTINKVCDQFGSIGRGGQGDDGADAMAEEFSSKCSFNEKGSGMSSVPLWLKGLRLHKYLPYFSKMSYETMMNLNEEQLERMNITKGARHKIVLNIQKLRTRQENLRHLEKTLQEEGFNEVLKELKYILSTPIKPYTASSSASVHHQRSHHHEDDQKENNSSSSSSASSSCANPNCECDNQSVPDGDLPGQIVRTMGKVCSSLLMSSQMDEESLNAFISLINICLNQEYFNCVHKRRFSSWKIQLEKSRRNQSRQLRGRKWNGQQRTNIESRQTASLPSNHRQLMQSSFLTNNQSINQMGFENQPPHQQQHQQYSILKRQDNCKSSLIGHNLLHANLYRTQSAPSNQIFSSSGHFETGLDYDRLNNQTESLCLRVTEQALGSLDGGQTF